MPRVLALFSGGLDGALAIEVLRRAAVDPGALVIVPVWVRVPCGIREARVNAAARGLDQPVITLATPNTYDELLLAAPRTGQGGAPPCRDCRVMMFRAARRYLEEIAADFVISGEVLGQDIRIQRRRDLDMIAIGSGLDDRLLRPLSARRLSPTRAERDGIIDRQRLLDLQGTGRRAQLALAAEWGIDTGAFSRGACALAEATLAGHVQRLQTSRLPVTPATIAALRLGRVSWLDDTTVIVVSRRAEEADGLRQFVARRELTDCLLLELAHLAGPTALLLGAIDDRAISAAQQLVLERIDEPASSSVQWLTHR
ncbi:MAG: hypothetical protein JNM18_26795 [Planctomycetaceae bacterium]|nr:hypothetical protein [Planctomycetaceae bacterium]